MTNTTHLKAPGWYTDPMDPALIRYWDGRAWTDRLRPRPAWAPPLDDEAAARHVAAMQRRRRRWAQGVGTLLVGALVVLTLFAIRGDVPAVPERTVADTRFTEAANGLCARRLPDIRKQPPQPGGDERPSADEAFARRVERTADDLAELVVDLRALPVASADRPDVEGWFRQWDVFVNVGHRYADAIRTAGNRTRIEVASEGDAPSRRIYAFAMANGMPDCVLDEI